MRNGFVKIHRQITEWGWYKDPCTARVFFHLLLTASYQDCEYLGKRIMRGQTVTGRKQLSEQLDISEQSVRTALNHLISTGEITMQSTNKYSVITIVNYGAFQDNSDETNQQISQQNNQPSTSDQPTTNHIKEYKEHKEHEEPIYMPEASAPGSPTVIELTLNDKSQYPISQKQADEWSALYPAIDTMQELRKMKGWLDANPAKRKTKGGIKRFVNGWLAREQDKGPRQDSQPERSLPILQ